ncbi:hypothetical protein [Eel River basin pequenovirus]|nr:hypothetical protein [Eel River basin pequenovirus]
MSVKSRMQKILETVTPGSKLDDTPIEIPAGTRTGKSISEEIQEQIAIQIALKQKAEGSELQTIGEIKAELLDLEEDEPPAFFSQFEYLDMVDELEPFEQNEPLKEGVTDDRSRDTESDGESLGDSKEDQAD